MGVFVLGLSFEFERLIFWFLFEGNRSNNSMSERVDAAFEELMVQRCKKFIVHLKKLRFFGNFHSLKVHSSNSD
jgi:hypothetical protein